MGPGSGNFGYNGSRNIYQSGNNPYGILWFPLLLITAIILWLLGGNILYVGILYYK